MRTLDDTLAELKTEQRILRQQYCIINASNSLSPCDLTRLYNELPKIGGKALCDHAPYYKFMTARPCQKALDKQELVAQPPNGTTQVFSNTDLPHDNQRLYILFSGIGKLFFLPTAMMLAILPDGPKTVLVIRSQQDSLYRYGTPGLGKTAFDVANTLRDNFHTDDYQHISVLGISAAGFFALGVTELLNAQIGLSFAGIIAGNSRHLTKLHAAGISAFDPICECRKQPPARLINVVSTKNEYDCLSSINVKKNRPSLIDFHLILCQHHNVLSRMEEMGYLRFFMRIALMENPLPIQLVAFPFSGLAKLIRAIRIVFGIQKVQKRYTENKRR